MGDGGCAGAGSPSHRFEVRLLVDANLSPVVADRLRDAGHDTLHVGDADLLTAADEEILQAAADDGRVIVSADADFGALLAHSGLTKPSFVLLRSADHLTPSQQGERLVANLSKVVDDLERGAIVTIARGRLRIRPLPVHPELPVD